MMTNVRACGLSSLTIYLNVKTHDIIREGNVTIRSEI